MDKQQFRNIITRPFEEYEIELRQGRNNMQYKYVPANFVVDRLNELGPENWSFEVKDSKEVMEEIVVLGSLQIGNVVKDAYGSATLQGKSAGDAFKSASALSLVKAASLMAVPCVFHSSSSSSINHNNNQNRQQKQTQQNNQNTGVCVDCGYSPLPKKVVNYSNNNYGKPLCINCQKQYNQNIRRVKWKRGGYSSLFLLQHILKWGIEEYPKNNKPHLSGYK